MKSIVVGSLESNDCLITLTKASSQKISIESIVMDAFGDQIKAVIEQVLNEADNPALYVQCEDKGALDYTIEARLKTALKRLKEAK